MTYQNLKMKPEFMVCPREADGLIAMMLHSKYPSEEELSTFLKNLKEIDKRTMYLLVENKKPEAKLIAKIIASDRAESALKSSKDLLNAFDRFAKTYVWYSYLKQHPEFNLEKFLKKIGEYDNWKRSAKNYVLVISGVHPETCMNGFWRYKFRRSKIECMMDEYSLFKQYGTKLKYRVYTDNSGMSYYYHPFDNPSGV